MSDVLGIGCDLCEISRMEHLLENERFLARCLTQEERDYIASRGAVAAASLAGLWAAKEAALKALGTGLSLPLTDIGVTHTEAGQPVYVLTGEALARMAPGKLLLSISHEGGMAAAFCVWVSG
ncbi:MAG: holo-ACP synthase [Clostridia bacterium]|nr:holo-ACP synthase [Clostridia bacterium]